MGRRLGLIIGINSYQDATFRPLQFAENDARALAQWLTHSQGGKWVPSDLLLLQGSQATHEEVEPLITELCLNEARPDDLVFIYFAGHAFLDQVSGDGYLAFANTRYQQPATGLHLWSLARQAIGPSRAAQILVILDCFQTGSVWSMKRSSPYDSRPLLGSMLLSALQQTEGRMFLCSCRGNELAQEVGEKNVGLLVHRMILGLGGPASDPATGQTSLQRLHPLLFNKLGEQQRPQLFGQDSRPLVLVGDMPPLPTSRSVQSPAGSFPTTVPPGSNGQRSQSASSGQLVAQTQTQAAQYRSSTGKFPPEMSPTTSGLLSPQMPAMNVGQALQQMSPTTSGLLPPQMSMTNSGQLPRQMSPASSGQLPLSGAEQQRQQQSIMLLNSARQLVQMQKPIEALQYVDQALLVAPTNTSALILKSQILGTVGRFQEALATVEQILPVEANNALVWSMGAALLTNMGRLEEALPAVERSLELDPNNPETLTIKATILASLSALQDINSDQPSRLKASPPRKRGGPRSVAIGMSIQLFALIIGGLGAGLLVLAPSLPIIVPFLLESFGLAVLCVNAARGCYLYGFVRFLLVLLLCGLTAGILGAGYRFGYNRLVATVIARPVLLIPVLSAGFWLALAATLPLLTAFGGLIGGLVVGVRRRR